MGWLFGSGLSGQCTTIDSPRISKRALFMGDFTCRCESPIRTLTPGNMASAASIKTVRKAVTHLGIDVFPLVEDLLVRLYQLP